MRNTSKGLIFFVNPRKTKKKFVEAKAHCLIIPRKVFIPLHFILSYKPALYIK